MYFFTSSDFLITLFGFIYSLAFNNRIENLILMTNFRGALLSGGPPIFPYFRGGPEAVPLLPPSRAGPACIYLESRQTPEASNVVRSDFTT